MPLPFFFCFLLFSQSVAPAFLATSQLTSFCHLRNIRHFPVVGRSEDILEYYQIQGSNVEYIKTQDRG